MRKSTIRRQGVVTRLAGSAGFTIAEMLIAALIMAVVTLAGFRFYSSMHGAAISQSDVSDLQHMARATMQDIRRVLRMAGFRLATHPGWQIKGDTLAVYFSNTKPVDTVKFFPKEFTSAEYAKLSSLPDSTRLYYLMKQTNSGAAAVFADAVSGWDLVAIDSVNVAITLTTHANRRDPQYPPNNGYRRFTLGQTITVQNP